MTPAEKLERLEKWLEEQIQATENMLASSHLTPAGRAEFSRWRLALRRVRAVVEGREG